MNLLKHLFGRHPERHSTSSSFISWLGQSGNGYPYEIHPVDTDLRPLPGIYIFAKQSEDGSWIPVYIECGFSALARRGA